MHIHRHISQTAINKKEAIGLKESKKEEYMGDFEG